MEDLLGFVSPARWVGHPVVVKAVTASTNDDARALAAAGCVQGTTVVADTQTAGRGRRGRAWVSPPGDNLYLSVVLRPRMEPAALAPLALVAGLAVAEAVEGFTLGSRVAVKWPNDVRVGGLKLAGVLVESSIGHGGLSHVIVGVGVNVRGTAPPPGLTQVATTMRAVRQGEDLSRSAVLAAVLTTMEVRVEAFVRHGLTGTLHAAVTTRCETLGSRVEHQGSTGVAVAIDPDGALRVTLDTGETDRVLAGDVSLVTPA